MSSLHATASATRETTEAPLLSACGAALARVEWRCLAPLLLFAVLFHGIVAGILLSHGLPVGYFPPGELLLLIVFAAGVLGCAIHVLAGQLLTDLVRKARGLPVPAVPTRFANIFAYTTTGAVLGVVFTFVMLANANLKPALFVLNRRMYDVEVEVFERALFGGVLPTEWLLNRSSIVGLHFWDFVYALFAFYLLISVMIAVYREGLRGGARLVLALAAGLMATLFMSLAWPTAGPIYVHPDWFGALEGTETAERAGDLAYSVRMYFAQPAVRFAVAGISALPSYHVLAWMCAQIVVWRHLAWPYAVLGFGMVGLNWISTIVLGWHYAVDGLAGILVAMLVCGVAGVMIPRVRRPAQDAAIPRSLATYPAGWFA